MESRLEHPSTSSAWRRPWWAGWLNPLAVSFAVVPYLDLLVGRRPGWPELMLGLALSGLFALGVFLPRLQTFGPVLCGPRPGISPRIALTYDDGPDPSTTPRVLEALGDKRATFFVIAEKARAHPELIAAMHEAGHQVCSHGFRHSWWLVISPGRARRLVLQASKVLSRTGIRERRFFRPPYGLMTPPLMRVLRRSGITPVGWSLRSYDTIRSGPADTFAQEIAERARNGDILLLHDAPERPGGRRPLGIDATGTLVKALESKGFELVTIQEIHDGDGSRPIEVDERQPIRRLPQGTRTADRHRRWPPAFQARAGKSGKGEEKRARTG
ncbi:polysaccharide deacetylase family protein [Imhoffiella purpurea]|uniref:Polysaccharide deacetylase n=1 Tax=Imhoffiella purpurea TaxID=1249627 RepID=W9V1E4_9GAMM|nr:polysaccharide deacetylase family protein [Imhoffiella purpurea]EXJ13288.1 Polysaccharide deacetylase [Imhoffiella purpurea]